MHAGRKRANTNVPAIYMRICARTSLRNKYNNGRAMCHMYVGVERRCWLYSTTRSATSADVLLALLPLMHVKEYPG